MYKLANYYRMGGSDILNAEGKPNTQLAFLLLKKAADQECAEAMRELGQIYEKGGFSEGKEEKFVTLTEINLEKALDLYKKAAEQRDLLALNYLGAYYYNHTKEYDKSVKLFKEASENGTCSRALNNLGMCFE